MSSGTTAPTEPTTSTMQCQRCGTTRPLSDFKVSRTGRRRAVCRECHQRTRLEHGLPATPSGRGVVVDEGDHLAALRTDVTTCRCCGGPWRDHQDEGDVCRACAWRE